MDAGTINAYIRQGLRKEVYADRIELYLPFVFGNEQKETLCLVWDEKGVLSDRGRTLAELKKRVGDLTPFMGSIQNVLKASGIVLQEGGQNLVVRHFQTIIDGDREYRDYMGGMNRLIRAISLISVVDSVKVDEDGAVSLC